MTRVAARPRAGCLPAEVTSFVGRRHEVPEVRRLLSQTRLLTLTGPGGVGKTRLALRVARGLSKAFPDGVWLVDLASLQEARLLAQAFADALGLRDESGRPTEEVLADHLVDKSLLLVLDNCEHLLDACAALVAMLLREAPGVRILATSREPLRVPGEYVFDVPPLSVPQPDQEIRHGDLARYEAAALLFERAQAAVPGFTVNDEGAAALVRIARRLDGLPLALELAAVRLQALSPQQLLSRLDDLFRALPGGVRFGAPRQRTLRSMIDWSFGLCSPAERTLWARMSVFFGSFDLEAAEAVCALDDDCGRHVLDLVTGLLEKSILVREEHPCGVRYRMLDTIRHYGRERLRESGDEAAMRRRHRDHYRRLADELERRWYTPHQVDWFGRMRLEHSNIRIALDYCAGEPGQAPVGLEIAGALRTYWHSSGTLAEGRRWFDRLLSFDGIPEDVRARGLLNAAWLALYLNDTEGACRLLAEARALIDRSGDPVDQAVAAHVEGLAALLAGDTSEAAGFLEEALARYRAAGMAGGVLVTLFYLASAVMLLGEVDRATALIEESVRLSESLGDQWIRGWSLWTQGIVTWLRGDPYRAAELERESIRRKQRFNDRMGIGQCVEVLAWTAAATGRPRRAARLLGAVQVIWRETGASLYRHLQGLHEEVEARVRAELGEKEYDVAWAEGAVLSYPEIVDHALERRPPPRTPEPDRAVEGPYPLTPREREVAGLVAEGMSNKQIAARLVISQRTVEGHIEHIMSKLGFTSRAQIAAWISAAGGGGRAEGG